MEYVFGILEGKEVLTTKGRTHSNLSGFREIERQYSDRTVTDCFFIVAQQLSTQDSEGNCYDRYEIDRHYRNIDKSKGLRETIGSAAQSALDLAAINFVASVQSGAIDATTAGEHADLFAEWSENGVKYEAGDIRRDPLDGALYQVVQAHTSQTGWNPSLVPALWKRFADPAEEWPEWSRPYGAHDAYAAGAKVSYNGKHYVSDVDNNVWAPDEYGWHQVDE